METSTLTPALVDAVPMRPGNDLYVLSAEGSILLTFDHHMFDDGLTVEFAHVEQAGDLHTRLNKMGAELELFFR